MDLTGKREFEYLVLDLEGEDKNKDEKLLNNLFKKRWKLQWFTSTINWEKQKIIKRGCFKRKLTLTNIVAQVYYELWNYIVNYGKKIM